MLTPIIARRIVAIAATVLVVIALFVDGERPKLRLHVFVTPDAWEEEGDPLVLNEPIRLFNQANIVVGEKAVRVVPMELDSGRVEGVLSARPRKAPDVWIPASSLWSKLLSTEHATLVDFDPDELVSSPQVLAVWKSLHERLGSRLGWSDVLEFARDEQAWIDRVGSGEGAFQMAHLNPERSTSGLSAAVSEFYLAAGKTERLRIDDVSAGGTTVAEIERSIIHYGPTSGDILEQFACFGPAYASVVYIQETSMHRFNEGEYEAPDDCREPHNPKDEGLEGYYPTEGTFIADYPCVVMHPPGSIELRERASERFCSWIKDWLAARPSHVEDYHFVPAGRLGGTDLPETRLGVPDGLVLQEVQREWKLHRRAADVLVAIDTSEDMDAELESIKAEFSTCLDRGLVQRDRVGMVSFSDQVEPGVKLGSLEETRLDLVSVVGSLFPGGGTALIDAVSRSVDIVRDQYDPSRITAVVVITDGFEAVDASHRTTLSDLEEQLKRRSRPVRVFLVEYGGDVRDDVEETIIDASQGRSFDVSDEPDPFVGETPIAGVCGEVFSFF